MSLVFSLLAACALPAAAPGDIPVGDTAEGADTAPPTDTASPEDTADTAPIDTSTDTDAGDPCTEPAAGRPMGFADLMARLEAQGCLAAEDIDALELAMEDFETVGLHCDEVLRAWSADGLSGWSQPELVQTEASVPDIHISPDNVHILTFNDVSRGRLVDLVRTDPDRLFRQGLLGLGGMGMAQDAGAGFDEVTDLDLRLPTLQLVVDPDLSRDIDGVLHLTWFGVVPSSMEDGVWDPVEAAGPHEFFRNRATELTAWDAPQRLVASTLGDGRLADPTLLDLGDGAEVLFLSNPGREITGWSSIDGVQWNPDAEPDRAITVAATTPDVVVVPGGGYRMYFHDNDDTFHVSTSTDGLTWGTSTEVFRGLNTSGLAVAVDPDGVWWLYYTVRDPACVAAG